MRILQMKVLVAALFGAALLPAAADAATFSGSSADITDFAGGSEVSTAGTLVDAVNLLNDNVGGVGVSTTINGVLFKGTQPGPVPRRRRVVCECLVRLSRRRRILPTADLWTIGRCLRHAGRFADLQHRQSATRTSATATAWSI